ncbi:hypothetical protein CYMTET_44339 [Cymbomonas tetramitiformis]|uniref:Uncharacterized protein n=1 Tax=Cymbomonas tetramitiformis TaxID=36881 RepID=A0AAE0C0F7_9CHLO|nr:hypothetical protein CYMTET_44339 [Cymbomonas tetramitiformis]
MRGDSQSESGRLLNSDSPSGGVTDSAAVSDDYESDKDQPSYCRLSDRDTLWILPKHEPRAVTKTGREMCVVSGQVVVVHMQNEPDAMALVVDVASGLFLKVIWYEGEQLGAADRIDWRCIQQSCPSEAWRYGELWFKNAEKALFDADCWYTQGKSIEIGCHASWRWNRRAIKQFGFPTTMPTLTRRLWDSVLTPALSMGLEMRANETLKELVEILLLSPVRRLVVTTSKIARGTGECQRCDLCKTVCSRNLYKLAFKRKFDCVHDYKHREVAINVGSNCAASCVLAYDCISLASIALGYTSAERSRRYCPVCHRMKGTDYDKLVETYSGRIMRCRGAEVECLAAEDSQFRVSDYLKERANCELCGVAGRSMEELRDGY